MFRETSCEVLLLFNENGVSVSYFLSFFTIVLPLVVSNKHCGLPALSICEEKEKYVINFGEIVNIISCICYCLLSQSSWDLRMVC